MAVLWIVHRDPRLRAALARLAPGEAELRLGSPTEAAFETAPPPTLVVLGVAGEPETELEFAHRIAQRFPDAHWTVVAAPTELARARVLFDQAGFHFSPFPPTPRELRERLAEASLPRPLLPLSERRLRDRLARRFARWFGDLDLPDLMRALDPSRAGVPLLIRGEPGTGRTLLARYAHHFAGRAGPSFVVLPCQGTGTAPAWRERIREALRHAQPPTTLCLQEVDRLPAGAQRELAAWIDLGGPPLPDVPPPARWVATAHEPDAPGRSLTPELEAVLAELAVELPPLRDRSDAIVPIALDAIAEWCEARQERPRGLADDAQAALREYPWPGNLRELEALLRRTLAAVDADPIRAAHLRFESEQRATRPRIEVSPAPRAPAAAGTEPRPSAAPPGLAPASPSAPARGTAAEATPGAEPPRSREPVGVAPDMERWRRLARAVVHGVRNPLTTIRSFAELLPERFEDADFRERFAELVRSDAARVEAAIDWLARFGRLEEPELRPTAVGPLVERVLEQRRSALAAARLVVLRELDPDLPAALTDPDHLALALEALLDWARAEAPAGGDLYLALRRERRGGPAAAGPLRLELRTRTRHPVPNATGGAFALAATAIEIALAEVALAAQRARLRVEVDEAREIRFVIELPAA